MRRGIANKNTHQRLTKRSCRLLTGRISPPTGTCLPPLTVGLRSKTRSFRACIFMADESRDFVLKNFTVTRSRDSLQVSSLLECSVRVFQRFDADSCGRSHPFREYRCLKPPLDFRQRQLSTRGLVPRA